MVLTIRGCCAGAGVGSNRTGNPKQVGYNRDNICYPTNLCTRTPGGYRLGGDQLNTNEISGMENWSLTIGPNSFL